MKILFVSSGNSKSGISPIIFSQGASLLKANSNIQLDYFTIKGKGVKGYYQSISKLRKHLKTNKYDVIHAHYSLSAFVASLAGASPLVVSLMGSDIKANRWFKWLILMFNKLFWKIIIVKSEDMKLSLGFKKTKILPNGVDVSVFYPQDKENCQTILNWDIKRKHILFPSNPKRPEKNYFLLEKAMDQIGQSDIQIHTLIDVKHKEVPLYLNAADVVVLTSLWEGSPNAIKEAMACNRPIVSTNVGDVKWLLGTIKGLCLSSFDKKELIAQIQKALHFSEEHKNTKGRERIENLNLNSEKIAKKLIKIYKDVK
ncbi:MAG: glycosyltransferase [Flavobacteriaceae bacterium]